MSIRLGSPETLESLGRLLMLTVSHLPLPAQQDMADRAYSFSREGKESTPAVLRHDTTETERQTLILSTSLLGCG